MERSERGEREGEVAEFLDLLLLPETRCGVGPPGTVARLAGLPDEYQTGIGFVAHHDGAVVYGVLSLTPHQVDDLAARLRTEKVRLRAAEFARGTPVGSPIPPPDEEGKGNG